MGEGIGDYDYNNANDTANFCPALQVPPSPCPHWFLKDDYPRPNPSWDWAVCRLIFLRVWSPSKEEFPEKITGSLFLSIVAALLVKSLRIFSFFHFHERRYTLSAHVDAFSV